MIVMNLKNNKLFLCISFQDSNRKILEGLPDTFIMAMKQLFTLLDIENSGHVHIEDIAEHWSIDGAGAVLPPNIIPSLRKVTTPGGYLTFERFCAGLKIAILRHSAQRHRQADTDSSEGSMVRIPVFFLLHRVLELRKFLFWGKVVMFKFVLK